MSSSRFSDEIRLRVELNSRIKFCMMIGRRSSLLDLKENLVRILKRSYHIRLPDFVIRIENGYQILDIYKIGDVIDDNQIIFIDPFSPNSDYSSMTRLEKIKEPVEVETEFQEPKRRRQASLITEKPENINLKGKGTLVTSANFIADNVASKNVQLSKEQPLTSGTDIKINSGKIEIKTPTSTRKTNVTVDLKKEKNIKDGGLPPRPENFKGFVIKKDEISPKNTNAKFEQQTSFKSLKKRKADEDIFEIA